LRKRQLPQQSPGKAPSESVKEATMIRLVCIEIDRVDSDRGELRAVGFVGPVGGPGLVDSTRAARKLTLAEAAHKVDSLRAQYPGLILRTVPAPALTPAFVNA
jgi:hypothetical protein